MHRHVLYALALTACTTFPTADDLDPVQSMDFDDVSNSDSGDDTGATSDTTRDTYVLDLEESPTLEFRAWGLFGIPSGGTWTTYNVRVSDVDGPESYAVEFICDMDSVETGNTRLNTHIRTTDFLDVERHPTAEFTSTSVTSVEGNLYEVVGDMTLRGTTREIHFDTTIEPTGSRIHTTAEIEFSRWDFGLYADNVDAPGGDGANDLVVVNYDVTLRLGE